MATLGAANLAAWTAGVPASAHAVAAAWTLLAVVAAVALRHWWRTAPGRIVWDGEAWRLGDSSGSGAVAIVLDLQGTLLLRFAPQAGKPHWLWLERRSDPTRSDDLRRAVYSRANPEPPPAEPSAAAQP